MSKMRCGNTGSDKRWRGFGIDAEIRIARKNSDLAVGRHHRHAIANICRAQLVRTADHVPSLRHHEIERAFVFSDGVSVRAEDLSITPQGLLRSSKRPQGDRQLRDLKNVVAELQNEEIKEAIAAAKGNKKKAAASLGI